MQIRIKFTVTYEALVEAEIDDPAGNLLPKDKRDHVLDNLVETIALPTGSNLEYVDGSFEFDGITDEDGKQIKGLNYRYP